SHSGFRTRLHIAAASVESPLRRFAPARTPAARRAAAVQAPARIESEVRLPLAPAWTARRPEAVGPARAREASTAAQQSRPAAAPEPRHGTPTRPWKRERPRSRTRVPRRRTPSGRLAEAP